MTGEPIASSEATKQWRALLEAWQVARAAELAAFPTIDQTPTPQSIEALEAYLGRKSETCDVMVRMLEFMRHQTANARRRA